MGEEVVNSSVEESKPSRSADVYLKALFGKVLRCASEKLDRVRIEAQQSVACALRQRYLNPLETCSTDFCREEADIFRNMAPSSTEYFRYLLDLQTNDRLAISPFEEPWSLQMLEGFVTSADTGNEDLVRASRAAIVGFCSAGENERDLVSRGLVQILRDNKGNDRVEVSALEVIAFLFDVRIFKTSLEEYVSCIQNAALLTSPD